MTTTLVVRFVLGRYHATPWQGHVNEGEVELPPSPWRLLRALYAVWRTRVGDLDEAVVRSLLARLAEPPTFFVPPYRLGHTRHYYPSAAHRTGTPSTDRTLDAFAAFEPGAELGIRWPGTLPPEEHKALARLAESLPYLGRADGLCEAEVVEGWEPSDAVPCAPLDLSESVGTGQEAVPRLSPTLPLDIDALTLRPVDVLAGKLRIPPGTRFVAYDRPPEAPPARRARQPVRRWTPVPTARFTVTQPALPPLTEAVALTDRLRRAAVQKLNRIRGNEHGDTALAGRRSGHRHAHFLAVPDGQRRVADLVVWAPAGLGEDDVQALSAVQVLGAPDGAPGPGPVTIRLAAYGEPGDVLEDLTGPATAWRSVTPFVPPHHAKREWPAFVRDQVHRELARRDLPAPVQVQVSDGGWREFRRGRPSKSRQRHAGGGGWSQGAGPPGAMVAIRFAEPVRGPLALGHLSHFGLGLFRPG